MVNTLDESAAPQTRVRQQIELPLHRSPGERQPTLFTFDDIADGREHVALVWGPLGERPFVRIHSECLTGDVLGSARCDCGEQLAETMRQFAVSGGILLYLRQEGRGIGLYNKIDAYSLQDRGVDTVDANVKLGFAPDMRQYDVAAHMLRALGSTDIVLVTNNPEKVAGLEKAGVRVRARKATGFFLTPSNRGYMEAKRIKMGHLLPRETPADGMPMAPADGLPAASADGVPVGSADGLPISSTQSA